MTYENESGYRIDRDSHWYIIGRSQSGKTAFMKNLMLNGLEHPEKRGLCFLDLHGDAAREVLGIIPRERIQDVIYFDPLSPTSPAFNFLRLTGEPHDIAEDLKNLFQQFSQGSWGPRLQQLLRNTLLGLIYDMRDSGNVWTLRDAKTFLINEKFRNEIISRLRPSLREFWDYEFPHLGKDAINPVTNKLDDFLIPESPIARVFSEPENEIDFNSIIENGKILICRFSKGELKQDPTTLLGVLFSRGIQQAALARSRIPIEQRKPFYLLVDECQNLMASPFDSIITETAKFRIFLTLAHHRLNQFSDNPDMRHAVMGSKVFVTFRLQEEDAPTFTKYMHRTEKEYRVKGRGEWKPVSNLIIYARGLLAEKIDEYEAEVPKGKVESYTERQDRARRRLIDVTDAFIALRNENIGIDALSEITNKEFGRIKTWKDFWGEKHEDPGVRLFPDILYRERTFPSSDDFANLSPFNAFVRVDIAADVFPLVTPPPPHEDNSIRDEILRAHAQRASERKQRRQSTEEKKSQEQQEERQQQKRYETDDDFAT